MRRAAPLLPALAAVLLLAGCGSERADSASAGAAPSGVSDGQTPVSGPGKDGVRIVAMRLPSSPSPFVVAAAPDVSATYEVTNDSTEARTYTILFDFAASDGEVMTNKRETVRDVAPGRTVRRTVDMGVALTDVSSVTQVKISEVTSVPADEAPLGADEPPADPGACPSSGVRVTVDKGDAAMGLRVVGLWLDNCGKSPYKIKGYPQLTLLDEEHKPVDGVQILQGSGDITTAAGPDEDPRPVTLQPGKRARATLVWRNTTQAGTPVNVPHVRVVAKPGAAPVTVTPHLDLGTTGQLGVRPWKEEE